MGMAGDTLDSDSTMVRHLAIERPASEELASRTPLSPVTRNVPVSGSPSKLFEGIPLSRSLARGPCENQEDAQHRSSIGVSDQLQQAAGGAQGLSRMSPAAGYAELGGRTQHQRGASVGSFRCENEAKDILGDTDRPPARTMSLKSEDSFSQIAEEAKFLGQLLCAEADDLVPQAASSSVGEASETTGDFLSHLEPFSHSAAPSEDAAPTAGEVEQQHSLSTEPASGSPNLENQPANLKSNSQPYAAIAEAQVHLLSTPFHSTRPALSSDTAHHAHSITGSGRKRPRHGVSEADSSAGEHAPGLFHTQHTAPLPASALGREPAGTLRHEQTSKDNRDHLIADVERSLAHGHAAPVTELPSCSSSASDDLASQQSGHSGHIARIAARAVAQVMGSQALMHSDRQAMSFERVALAVNHESALASLESALREIISLQGIVLDQAQQVGALGAAQECLRRQLRDHEELQGFQGEALQYHQLLTLQKQEDAAEQPAIESPSCSPTPESPAPPGASEFLSAQLSPADGTAGQAGTVWHSRRSAVPSPAAGLAQAPSALRGTSAQTLLSSLQQLSHRLNSPQDMAAARIHAPSPAQSNLNADGTADISHMPISASDMKPFTLFNSPAKGCTSEASSPAPAQSSSPRIVSPEQPGSVYELVENSSSGTAEQNPLFDSADQDHDSMPGGTALPTPAEVSVQSQHASDETWEQSSTSTERANALLDSIGDDDDSEEYDPKTAYSWTSISQRAEQVEERDAESSSMLSPWAPGTKDIEQGAPIPGPSPFQQELQASEEEARKMLLHAPDGLSQETVQSAAPGPTQEQSIPQEEMQQDGTNVSSLQQVPDDAHLIITSRLQQELLASRDEAAQARQASAADRQALEVSHMEGEEMAMELCKTQEQLTTLQAEVAAVKQLSSAPAMPGYYEDSTAASMQSMEEMLRNSFHLLEDARSQLASRAQAARKAERTIAELHEDVQIKVEQLVATEDHLKAVKGQIAVRDGMIEAGDLEEARVQALLEQEREVSAHFEQEAALLRTRLEVSEASLAESESAGVELQTELVRERADSHSLVDELQQSQQAVTAVEGCLDQAQAALAASETSRNELQVELQELRDQHASEMQQVNAAFQRQRAAAEHLEGSLRQEVLDLRAHIEEQQHDLSASAESRADLVEQQEVLSEALVQRQLEVKELKIVREEQQKDLGILEGTLRASIDSRTDANDRTERLQRQLNETTAELTRSQESHVATVEDLMESQKQSFAAAAVAEQPALMPVFDDPHANDAWSSSSHRQIIALTDDPTALKARLIDAAMEQQPLIKENADLCCAARFWEESADSLAEQLYQKDLKLDNARGQLKELGVERCSTRLELAQQAEHSWTPSCQLELAPAQEGNAHCAPQLLLDKVDDQVLTPTALARPALQEAAGTPCSQPALTPATQRASPFVDTAYDHTLTPTSQPDLHVNEADLQLGVWQRVERPLAADAAETDSVSTTESELAAITLVLTPGCDQRSGALALEAAAEDDADAADAHGLSPAASVSPATSEQAAEAHLQLPAAFQSTEALAIEGSADVKAALSSDEVDSPLDLEKPLPLQGAKEEWAAEQIATLEAQVKRSTAELEKANAALAAQNSQAAQNGIWEQLNVRQEAAEGDDCQQCIVLSQQLELLSEEADEYEAEHKQLQQQVEAFEQDALAQCLKLSEIEAEKVQLQQRLEGTVQDATAQRLKLNQCEAENSQLKQLVDATEQDAKIRRVQLSQQLYAKEGFVGQLRRELEDLTWDRNSLAAKLADTEAALTDEKLFTGELREVVRQQDSKVSELKAALSAFQQEQGDMALQLVPHGADLAGTHVDPQSSIQEVGDVAGLQDCTSKLEMELAALTADRDHFKALHEALTEPMRLTHELKPMLRLTAESHAQQQLAISELHIIPGQILKTMQRHQMLPAHAAGTDPFGVTVEGQVQRLIASAARQLLEDDQPAAQPDHALVEVLSAQRQQCADLEAGNAEVQAELDAAKQAKEENEASHRSELFQAQKRAATLDMQLGNAKRLLRIVEDAAAGSKHDDGGMPSEADSEAQVWGGALVEHHGDSGGVAAPELCAQPFELAPEMQSPVQGLCSTAQKACSPLLETAELSPITDIASPGTPAAAQATILLSPIAAEQTPLVIFDASATTRPCSSLSKGLPEGVSPGDKLQWLADQVAREIHSMKEIGTADMGAADPASSAGITCASNAALKNEAAEPLVARLMLERHLQKKAIDVATAITKDAMTGSSQAAAVAKQASVFVSAHETALKKAKLNQTWASLLAMAQNPPERLAASLASAKEEVELLQRKAELLEEVIQDQDAQAAKALAECDSLLSNAASDVGNLCQGLYDTFPCLEDSVPAIEGPQAAYTLEPAGMLELQVSRVWAGLQRLYMKVLSSDADQLLGIVAPPDSPGREAQRGTGLLLASGSHALLRMHLPGMEQHCPLVDEETGTPQWQTNPEGRKVPRHTVLSLAGNGAAQPILSDEETGTPNWQETPKGHRIGSRHAVASPVSSDIEQPPLADALSSSCDVPGTINWQQTPEGHRIASRLSGDTPAGYQVEQPLFVDAPAATPEEGIDTPDRQKPPEGHQALCLSGDISVGFQAEQLLSEHTSCTSNWQEDSEGHRAASRPNELTSASSL